MPHLPACYSARPVQSRHVAGWLVVCRSPRCRCELRVLGADQKAPGCSEKGRTAMVTAHQPPPTSLYSSLRRHIGCAEACLTVHPFRVRACACAGSKQLHVDRPGGARLGEPQQGRQKRRTELRRGEPAPRMCPHPHPYLGSARRKAAPQPPLAMDLTHGICLCLSLSLSLSLSLCACVRVCVCVCLHLCLRFGLRSSGAGSRSSPTRTGAAPRTHPPTGRYTTVPYRLALLVRCSV